MPTIIGIGRRNMAKKLSNKGKEALAFKVMCAASDMLLSAEENKTWYDEELEALAESEEGRLVLAETVAKWMTKLPGKVWITDLPKVWSADYERPIFNENGEFLYRVPSMEDENREREEG
jgi:hypothetical protein